MKIKIYKHKESEEQIIITNDNVINRKTDEKYVLYRFRRENEVYLMPYHELLSDYTQIDAY